MHTTDILKRTSIHGELFIESHDEERFKKAASLAEKLIDEEFVIGFAGHFSAGKSSMINALTGEDLLPSSPIPTSANIVKVKKTEQEYVIIHKTDGATVKLDGHGFPDAIKAFSKDGAEIALIEIGHPNSALPEAITVMDTPGVDSTDDAHRMSTESALHLADLVFYTMDYNHVQSELNFKFTKELLRYNPNVYLIINQIDKHRDSELSFSDFKKSVEDSFRLWGVEPKAIFYTSLRDQEHPHNDFKKVKSIVDGSISNWEAHFLDNADQSLLKLQEEHLAFLQDELEERKSVYAEIVAEDEWHLYKEIAADVKELKTRASLLGSNEFYASFESERNELLRNASISPFETRELMKAYIESKSPRFKVGLLFGAKKTAEERDRRRSEFDRNLSDLVHTQIEVHLKALMKNTLKRAGLMTDERSIEIDEMDMSIPFDEIDQHLPVSDVMTGDTVLNMAEQMKTGIQQILKKRTDAWKMKMSEIAADAGNEHIEHLLHTVQTLETKLNAIAHVEKINMQLTTYINSCSNPSVDLLKKSELLLDKWTKKPEIEIVDLNSLETNEVSQSVANQQTEDQIAYMTSSYTDAGIVIEQAQRIADAVMDIPGFLETAHYLKNKSERLAEQEFTVALFGAFSAGKSSFSNALIGDRVLPVSPNPTTAAINRIRPVMDGKEDRTADVHLKSEQQMLEDVAFSFEALGIPLTSLKEAFDRSDEVLTKELDDESLHIHKTFIRAFQKGYPIYHGSLGQSMNVNQVEFTRFVAEEDRSCFVDSIDLFIDCALTRQGITLVDTPGADSINARHTDVAFEYIRNADAILFITYYNHAFARADREFLIQLGRVKDAFELDKMFFIVNAIDLASNEEEAEAVKSFVEQELTAFGIRHPRVHGISSLQALDAKLAGNEDPFMQVFESHFEHFLKDDLKGLAIQALEEEVEKTIHRLATLIERTESNRTRKAERLAELNRLEQEIRTHYMHSFAEVIRKASINELNELVYYILQRVFLRFGDFFKEGYSPSTFANHSTEKALTMALNETVQMVGFDLTQELKVTNLRMLNFMNKQLKERQRTEMRRLTDIDQSISPSPYEPDDADMLSFKSPFEKPSVYSGVNRLFKNQKAFFEKGERLILREQLEERLKQDSSLYLGNEKERIEQWAEQWIEGESEGLRKHLLNQSVQQIESERALLSDSEQLEEWRTTYEKIRLKESD
ncbi:dynamin family protein [Sporosarcina oncorhynchi]|uniref:Dynamin family protein n=1 Tax=Sporosarcina oncorhynchi TaxID=3056444 RepID=A0ABZ0L958_9BACL|nr:dynamin family protein [Sporosarcina sp. T2O-4]WOV89063.1 dynamin family protein [Sporosarcina sp. T2O-4]